MLYHIQENFLHILHVSDELSMNLSLHKFYVFNSYLAKSWYEKRRFIIH